MSTPVTALFKPPASAHVYTYCVDEDIPLARAASLVMNASRAAEVRGSYAYDVFLAVSNEGSYMIGISASHSFSPYSIIPQSGYICQLGEGEGVTVAALTASLSLSLAETLVLSLPLTSR